MDIGRVKKFLDKGCLMAREGWNGLKIDGDKKPMYIYKVEGKSYTPRPISREYNIHGANEVVNNPHIDMKTKTGEVCIGWLCSQTDFFADDWVEVDRDGKILTYADGRTNPDSRTAVEGG